jgi:hypothetical protein
MANNSTKAQNRYFHYTNLLFENPEMKYPRNIKFFVLHNLYKMKA